MKLFENGRIKNIRILNIGLAAVSLILLLSSFGFGFYNMGLGDIMRLLSGTSADPNGWIILGLRLPRIIAAYLIGAALSVSGAAYQGVLKNPLVSPDILGVASGAGMGAAAAIMLRLSYVYVQVFALAAGTLAAAVTYFIARNVKFDSRMSLILSGTLVGSLAFSVTTTFKYLADTADQLPEITYWLMGSLSKVDMSALVFALPFMAVGFVILFLMRWRMNVLTLSDIEASTIGINTKRSMQTVILGATMLCSSAVCLGGLIAWVGLMIPHIARALVGPQYTKLLPTAAMTGGLFLLVMDDIVRSVSIMEIPIGLAIAFIGAPFFYMLIRKGKKS